MAAGRRRASSFHAAKNSRLREEGRKTFVTKTMKGSLNSRERTSGKRYLGFCPWRECPDGGPGLPPIDRVKVGEHLASCRSCCDSESACAAAGQQPREGPLCVRCFFDVYIGARKPCILRLLPTEELSKKSSCAALADSRALKCWSDLAYLTKVAGGEMIDVEVRDAGKGQVFGAGQYQQMAFGQVIRRLAAGDTSLYVTTQRIASNRHGPKALCGPPLSNKLAADFPVKVAIAGNLVPYQFNVWIGDSREGSTTGLHHDFHDNFYCLIRGRKEFRLFSPRLCELLKTHGMKSASNDVVLHPNGLISYLKGIREDGAHEASVLRARQNALERKADELRELLAGHKTSRHGAAAKKGSDEVDAERKRLEDELSRTEAELDKCLDAALDAAAANEGEAEDDASLASEDSDFTQGRLVREGAMPDHFCLAGTRTSPAASCGEPLTSSTVLEKFWSVWLEEGDTLYLPAGWFHEVISYSPGSKARSRKVASDGANVHLAFNIWLHPPVWNGTFDKPYADEFWAQHAAPQIELQHAASTRVRPPHDGASGRQSDSRQQGNTSCPRENNQALPTASEDLHCSGKQERVLRHERRRSKPNKNHTSLQTKSTRGLLLALMKLRRLRRGPQRRYVRHGRRQRSSVDG
ncbi:hypothetical protein Esti_001062 [Eimeria stiedai]